MNRFVLILLLCLSWVSPAFADAIISQGKLDKAIFTTYTGIKRVPVTRTVNGQPLSSNVTVTTITGNAGTATKLATARAINGVNFDGTVPVTINAVDSTAREPTITAGTAAQYWRGDKTWQTTPTTLPASDVYSWAKAATKPAYTASEISLGNVTNESKATMFTSPVFTGTPSMGEILIGSASKLLYLRTISGRNRIDSYDNPITTGVPLQLNGSTIYSVINDVEAFRVDSALVTVTGSLNVNSSVTSNDSIKLTNTNVSGAAIQLTGNGATTPTKFIRAYGGNLQVLNSALSAAIVDLTDAGNVTFSGTVKASGGATNKATCWKSTGVLGYCSTVVAADGSCTCN